ncbi:MAG: hypothetical protein MI725_03130, partial [Pirellulales bacterium]|nr:hypothetical protein [Pirellulales bacterium]
MRCRHPDLPQARRSSLPFQPAKPLLFFVAFFLLLASGAHQSALAQVVQPVGSNLTPEQIQQMQEARRRAQRGGNNEQNKKADDKSKEKKEEGEKGDAEKKKDSDVKTLKRPTDKPNPVDLDRVPLQPDANGLVQFSYNGHPWTEVLQDYADAAKLSFDWQELPADYLNLMTQRKYTLTEARDLLNRHLLARGFTMIVQGEVLSVVNVKKLDSSLIPRVSPDDLEDYAPYDFVRARFQLPLSMDPAKVKDDVQVLLSPNGKVTPLLATRRLLVIDAVANLRNVRDLIYAEQMAFSSEVKPVFYQIRFRRADYVADQVMIVLGKDPASRKTPQELQIEQQRMQLYAQMQKKGKDVSKMIKQEGPAVHIAVNRRQNSLLVNAAPELLPIIDQTIKQLDVPDGGGAGAGAGGLTMKKYHTVTISTDAIVTALKEIGNLDPLTQIQSDKSSKTIFASATLADHVKIQEMIDRLDGTGRRPEVIWLPPQLRADQVAGSIMALIVGPDEEKDDNRNSFFYWRYSYNQDEEEELNDGFRVLPDVENNRLLLWANDDELAEVKNLIDKLERNEDGTYGDNRKVRRFEARNLEETRRLLKQLEKSWTGENRLEIEAPPPAEDNQKKETDNQDKVADRGLMEPERRNSRFRFAQLEEKDAPDKPSTQKSKPPIKILVNEQGEIVIASDDVVALQQLEELMTELAPPVPEFHYFKLKYIYASTAVMNLEEYFADEIGEDGESILDWWGRRVDTKPKQGPITLGKRPPLRFVYDPRSNTVVVANASPSQLEVIKQLIEIYDAPPEAQEYPARRTETVKIRYSRAQDIANALKEVYRELLSSTDKEFQDKEGKTGFGGIKKPYAFGNVKRELDGDKIPVLIRFEGALSVGVDSISNTLIISARAEILDSIKETIAIL